MKYINHMTCAHDDEKMQRLIDLHGMAGYGAYWLITEKIASQIRKESMSTSLRLSYRSWGHSLHVDPRTASKWIRSIGECGLAIVEHDSNGASINIPNLLKYGDEYIKRVGIKSRVSPDNVGSLSHLLEVPALPKEKKDLKDLQQPVDNSNVPLLTDGADDGGNGSGAIPPPAPLIDQGALNARIESVKRLNR
jgi:hypothetical protein